MCVQLNILNMLNLTCGERCKYISYHGSFVHTVAKDLKKGLNRIRTQDLCGTKTVVKLMEADTRRISLWASEKMFMNANQMQALKLCTGQNLGVNVSNNQRNRGHSSKFNFAHTLYVGRP